MARHKTNGQINLFFSYHEKKLQLDVAYPRYPDILLNINILMLCILITVNKYFSKGSNCFNWI